MTETCPTCGRSDETCQRGSNANGDLALNVPAALIPMMVHVLAIGRNTAMMNRALEAQEALEALRKIVDDAVTPLARKFDDDNWSAMLARMAEGQGPTFSIEDDGRHWIKQYRVVITDPNGKKWPKGGFRDPHLFTSEEFGSEEKARGLVAELEELAERMRPL